LICPFNLLFQRLFSCREQAGEVELETLIRRKCRALVEVRRVEQRCSGQSAVDRPARAEG
jgi:hypothetical protein